MKKPKYIHPLIILAVFSVIVFLCLVWTMGLSAIGPSIIVGIFLYILEGIWFELKNVNSRRS